MDCAPQAENAFCLERDSALHCSHRHVTVFVGQLWVGASGSFWFDRGLPGSDDLWTHCVPDGLAAADDRHVYLAQEGASVFSGAVGAVAVEYLISRQLTGAERCRGGVNPRMSTDRHGSGGDKQK